MFFQALLCLFALQDTRVYSLKSSKSAKTSTIYKNLQEDVNRLKANNVKCSVANNRDVIISLSCEGKLDEALLCSAEKLLNGHSSDGKLWTIIGQIYHRRNKLNKGNKCFKEAAKLSGKLVNQISLWHFLGPFQTGKPEIDGDPVESLGSITKIYCRRFDGSYRAYSELVDGGEIKWTTIRPQENGVVSISPKVDWRTLVMGLQSMAITEWQGWLGGDIVVNSEMTMLIQCLGVHTIYINDHILAGDVYRRDQYWHPIHLKPGVHSVLLRARSKADMVFSCNIKPSESSEVFECHKPLTPDVVDGYIFSNIISVPVSNHSPTKWLKVAKVTLLTQDSGPDISISLDRNMRGMAIAPGQVRPVILYFKFKNEKEKPRPNINLSGVLRLGSSEGKYSDVSFLIRCRKKSESFLFTFLDHDGSVQHAAAIFPIVKINTSPQIYPVLLTLHGTSVPAQNQADSYKRMEKDKWIFGVEGLWTLAPTRHGAHNWEGPGELTSMTALKKLAELTEKNDWVNTKANSKAVVFAGHSMGGHGAWQLSTHYPDIALAVVSIAGWIKKENYGDSNVFFAHDVSVSHTDPAIKYIMEACISENDADKQVSNLKGIPVMIRVGAKDSTVLPYYSRRMYRLLKEQGSDVTYSEIADKEHWWWDTYRTNDGGVVNDPEIRNFLIKHTKHSRRPIPSKVCTKTNGETCEEENTSRYQSENISNRNQAGSGQFTLTTYNPATSHGVRGVKVLQQISPLKRSVVEIKIADTKITLVTTNVLRLRLSEPAVAPVHWKEKLIIVDEVIFPVSHSRGSEFCFDNFETWRECPDANVESEKERGPANLGPARRIAENSLLIIIGSSSEADTDSVLRKMAVYIANLFYLTSEALVAVVRDKDVGPESLRNTNVIAIGQLNSFILSYLGKSSLRFENDTIMLGRCTFTSSDIGILSLVPHSHSRLALVITGTSLQAIRNVVHFATPTIPPMSRSPFSNLVPDYVITGPEFRAKGPGGYVCAGFWGNHWEYRSDTSSCSC